MNAAIYARYSSHAQREESIDQQVAVCRQWASSHGHEVVATYADEARSGRSTEGRDRFLAMVDDARTGAFQIVVVYKLDRFARDRYDAAIYRRRLRDCGVEVRSAMENIPDGPEGRLLEAVVEGVAEWYSADLSQKTLRGMRSNAERCRHNGVAVFGYGFGPDGRYVIDERQAATVRRVFAEWAEGVPATDIARRLDAEGVRTALGARPSKMWVSRVVADERYLGTYVWADVRVEGGMPRVVDDALWAAAHSRPRNPTRAPRRTHDYPLSGRLWDRATGLPMFGYSARGHGGEYAYYGVVEDGHRRLVRKEVVEDAVVRAVRLALSDAALVDDVVARVMERERARLDSPDVLGARAALRAADAEDARLARAIADGMPLDSVRPLAEDVAARKRRARAAIAEAERGAVSEGDVRAAMAALATWVDDGEVMRHCVESVVIDRSERAVVVTLPIAKKSTPTSELVSVRNVWLPMSCGGSNWQVVDGRLLLRAPLAA